MIIAIGLLIFGCIGSPPAQQPTGGAGGGLGAPPGGAGGGAEETGAAGTEGAATGGTGTEGTPTGGETGGGGTTDYAGMAYGQLIALGAPVQCDIITVYQGETTTIKLYMKGENRIREEYTAGGQTGVVIMRDGVTYMEYPEPVHPDCHWLKVEPGAEETQPSEPGGEALDLTGVPSTSFTCLPWIYDESKFAVPANACTMDELTQKMMQQYQE